MKKTSTFTLLCTLFILMACTPGRVKRDHYDYSNMNRPTRVAYQRVAEFLTRGIIEKEPVELVRHSRIDTIIINKKDKKLDVYLNYWFGARPFRESDVALIQTGLKKALGGKFRKYELTIYSDKIAIDKLVPNYYRQPQNYDLTRMPGAEKTSVPLVRNVSKNLKPEKGLYNRHIALWSSHGWYYEQKLDRWEWQRARVFQTVEDLLPQAFVTRYLIPMLENAGARVFVPRERDIQVNEVVVDNDSPDNKNSYRETDRKNRIWQTAKTPGFAVGTPPYTAGVNPFQLGTVRQTISDTTAQIKIEWVPEIPEQGDYAVYLSYVHSKDNVDDAHYTVYHNGGQTEFLVNQQMGGETWIYLGTFNFPEGQNAELARVELSNQSTAAGRIVTADAVRFGGGMGNVAREGQTSGRPRFTEAARYYLQYDGMPDTLVFSLNNEENDYKDDYQCRAEWVNYLKGAPYGPNKDRSVEGLKIPIDLSLGFHTDAGRTRNDTVIGTLSIFSTDGDNDERIFPDNMSRLANRDFADILQSQIVGDIRAKYDPAWNRRYLWDRGYSEAYRPNVPAALLELLSHHNFLDMKFALDPDFRFHASRAIYKAILRFLATQYGYEYQVQPLPVTHFQALVGKNGQVDLKWQPTEDPLELTAVAEEYIVYTRREGRAFDNGIKTDQPEMTIRDLVAGELYSFKVTAVNDGGESFPSEILSVCYMNNDKAPVLIVNGFDRIAPPATIETDEYLGFMNLWDQGVPDQYDLDFIGVQYDLLADSPWLDDDAPGHGASYADFETTIIPGNTFDFPALHGKSIKALGHSFSSVSDETVMENRVDLTRYQYLDLILGEEKATDGPKPRVNLKFRAFPKPLQAALEHYCSMGGNLFVSGAYVGTDLFENQVDSLDMDFAKQVLGYRHRTNHAVHTGGLVTVDSVLFPVPAGLEFNTSYHPSIYAAEAPDAIEPADTLSMTLLRYAENNTSAAVIYAGETGNKVIIFGFPFETILGQENRDQLMRSIFDRFQSKE